ncbi:serine--tRNA ligase [Candidatus Phytoplasma fabacearum]|uniref:serine--tRNA ligase n=1 Tax=Candidatus Phytoplasma fabacearum TaxID=2982628 RepID=UPI002712B594|nr:serine--tRNA ligase ['Bituminaria bituminosa' little leaf phytoplasma]MDV3148750.1 serine--tRNA ligase [Pigeon pea little leaf phytoplasma]MDO7983642.1 serine--tRNA ligase ['Bituminaria bituminosa' little leaf phytoplasma]MDO8030451.1 serine--tRNA ligase ['Bituminaria bituminosa' little leaf phytoplasma]MDV3154216.1 serine--tRNA ligase [Pigeon pea little leaf phytoplasma]MDV3163472.1 serine--tRNA ligase [Pigeon pea little leaf phytoplasma]
MLDIKFILKNIDLVKNKLKNRFVNEDLLDKLIFLYKSKNQFLQKIERIKYFKNQYSRQKTNKSLIKCNSESILDSDINYEANLKKLQINLATIEEEVMNILNCLPNIPHESVPIGDSELDNIEVYRSIIKPRHYDFVIKDHLQLGLSLNILDFQKASKIVGSKFVVLKGLGARLERSLINFMIDNHISNKYFELIPPFIVNQKSMFATGQLPKFAQDVFKLQSNKYEWYLNPTAEVPTINLHRQEILDIKRLPIKYVSYTTCFREEAGSSGKNTKGIWRQKQFNKVELIQFVEPKTSYMVLEDMLKDAAVILDKLQLPYRIMLLSTGDLGFSMSKTYDIEVWLPSQQKYCEIASISNAEDFQARRANIKFKAHLQDKGKLVHTLNGSALAIGRTMAAILENYQNKDGSVNVPIVLQKYLSTDIIKN